MSERYAITVIGKDAGDKRLMQLGFRVELIDRQGDTNDGGPTCIAACPDVATAERIKRALLLTEKA